MTSKLEVGSRRPCENRIRLLKVKLFYVKILFDAQFKALNSTLLIGCCDLLFKAYLYALKRLSQAANLDPEKEAQMNEIDFDLSFIA